MTRDKRLHIILLGRSGSGKGTQAALLTDRFSLHRITVGDLFRDIAGGKTDTAGRVRKIIDGGGLPPQWIASYLWIREIIERVPRRAGILFDGTPRRREEAMLLLDVLRWYDRTRIIAVLINISEREAYARLTKRKICVRCGKLIPYIDPWKKLRECDVCGGKLVARRDDTSAGIRRRLQWYQKHEGPVVRFFKKEGILRRIDGEQSIPEVFQRILAVLS